MFTKIKCILYKIVIYIPICFYFNFFFFFCSSSGSSFTFQYVSILIVLEVTSLITEISFTFQYVSILISRVSYILLTLFSFTFQYVSILIHKAKGQNCRIMSIYIPICFYFNPSPEFPLLFYLISPLSVDQPKFTNILPYLLH